MAENMDKRQGLGDAMGQMEKIKAACARKRMCYESLYALSPERFLGLLTRVIKDMRQQGELRDCGAHTDTLFT